jgi:hypothetical protein
MIPGIDNLFFFLQASKGKSEIADNFLVEFGRKSRDRSRSSSSSDSDDDRRGGGRDYPARDSTEEWVEYTGVAILTTLTFYVHLNNILSMKSCLVTSARSMPTCVITVPVPFTVTGLIYLFSKILSKRK